MTGLFIITIISCSTKKYLIYMIVIQIFYFLYFRILKSHSGNLVKCNYSCSSKIIVLLIFSRALILALLLLEIMFYC